MRLILLLLFASALFSCGNKSAKNEVMFCDTACLTDTIKFIKEEHKLQPYLYISTANCLPDSVIWSYKGLGINRKLSFDDFGLHKFPIDKSNMICYIKDTSYIWWLFNDCTYGRGYLAKIPFNKKSSITRKGSALNKFDPKFDVAEGIVAYTDRGNIFIEEMSTGKQAMMTFGKMLDGLDYDAMHEYIDTIKITSNRIWAKILLNNKWVEKEKAISFE